jgi:hypothetical protein
MPYFTVKIVKTLEVDVSYFGVRANSQEEADTAMSERFDSTFNIDFGEMQIYPDEVSHSIHSNYEVSVFVESNDHSAQTHKILQEIANVSKANIEVFPETEPPYTWYGSKVGPLLLATGCGCPGDAQSMADMFFDDPKEYIHLFKEDKSLSDAVAIASNMVGAITAFNRVNLAHEKRKQLRR